MFIAKYNILTELLEFWIWSKIWNLWQWEIWRRRPDQNWYGGQSCSCPVRRDLSPEPVWAWSCVVKLVLEEPEGSSPTCTWWRYRGSRPACWPPPSPPWWGSSHRARLSQTSPHCLTLTVRTEREGGRWREGYTTLLQAALIPAATALIRTVHSSDRIFK